MKLQSYRGVSTENPENTLEAVRAAADQGYYSSRVDLGVTRDGQFVLLRGGSINRAARLGNGAELESEILISDLTYEQALEYDFGIGFSRKFAGERIAFLWDVLEFASKSGHRLAIDGGFEGFEDEQKQRLFTLLKEYPDTAELCCKTKKGLEYAVKALPKHCFHYYGELSDGFFETVESLALGDRLTVWTELDRSDLHAAIKKHARLGVSLLSEPSELDAAKKWGADIAETKGQLKPEANSGAIADMHTHSDISHDCRVRLEDMRQAAEACGVGLMAVTNHADVGFMNAKRIFEIISETAAEVMELNARNDSPCRLLTGVEIGDGIFDVGLMRFAEKAWDCDVIIGSVHCGTVDGRLEPYSKFDFSSRSDEFAEEFLADYFDNLNKTVDAADFDILAHLTCPLRYIVGKHKKNVDMSKYDGVINEILEKIIKKGIALELNTSSVSLAVGDFVPSREILKKYRAMGGYLVTLGSDAHVIEEAAANFDQALALLNELGFKNVYYYKKRRVLPIPVCG